MNDEVSSGATLCHMWCVCGKPCSMRSGGPVPALVPWIVTVGETAILNSLKPGSILPDACEDMAT